MSGGQPQRVVIAGAGWRVWRFVVPALLNVGVLREHLVLLRRTRSLDVPPALANVRTTTSIDELADVEAALVVNCASAPALVDLQGQLLRRWPRAVHFCDTPIYTERRELPQVLRFSPRVYSLEDWPLMPNLAYLARHARLAGPFLDARIEHFGILGHFLALYRTMSPALPVRHLEKHDATIVARQGARRRVVFRAQKQFDVAKAFVRTSEALVEDFHEVRYDPIDDPEVIYRLVDERGMHYCRGREVSSTHVVDPVWIASFEPLTDRKNVHELDKFIALTRLFRSTLGGSRALAYRYLDSVRDTATVRRLQIKDATWLW